MARIAGAATPAGTHAFAERGRGKLARGHFRRTAGNLELSSIGLGTYLGAPDPPTDLLVEQAAELAVRSGRVNVLDTAINYRHQRAERSLGRALARAIGQGRIDREMVFVASKAGYLAPDGESPLSPAEWIDRNLLRPGILSPDEIVGGCHAMSPRYLLDQVERSRENLGLETIDLLYLHNAPDTQLPVIGRSEFLGRLREAFTVLERLRASGAIGAYGLATWESLRVAAADPAYLALEEAVGVAREVGGPDHGFRFVQFPFNLALPEAASRANQPVGGKVETLFGAARRLGVGCFTSVPLLQGQLARRGPSLDGLTRAQSALQFARSAPATIGPVVGQKRPQHLSENLSLAERDPWAPEEFARQLS